MTSETGQANCLSEGRFRNFRRILIIAGCILCVDLFFAACSGQTDTLELTTADVQEQQSSDSAQEETAQGDMEENASEDVSGEDSSGSETQESTSSSETAEESAAQEDGNVIYVYICGAVMNPGVYELPEGTRVYEAIAAAGGFAADAEETYVNQALILTDQDELYIPTQTQLSQADDQSAAYGLTGGSDSGTASSAGQADSGKVNLNTASQEELESLPGIGSAKAAAIIAYREENGNFTSIEDIQNVSGIGEVLYGNLKDLITI